MVGGDDEKKKNGEEDETGPYDVLRNNREKHFKGVIVVTLERWTLEVFQKDTPHKTPLEDTEAVTTLRRQTARGG